MFDSLTHNAHSLNLETTADIKKQLTGIGAADRSSEHLPDHFRFFTIKMANVDARSAELMKSQLERLGGDLVMHREALDHTRSHTDVLLAGSKHALSRLSRHLKSESFDLDKIASEIERCLATDRRRLAWGKRVMDFSRKKYVMGILNCTPDSFFPGSRQANVREAYTAAGEMIDAGVDILDIGGESSRPGSDPVSAEEENERVIPLIKAIRREWDIMISIDTRKREVAERALDAGADIVNDISGLRDNEPLAVLIASRKVPVILMHMRGFPKTMQANPYYKDTIGEILKELQSYIFFALGAGIEENMIIIDPGIGFGKRLADNLKIIKDLAAFRSLGFPLLIGLSRKSFLGDILKLPVEKRLTGTITANTLAIAGGADIIRVHDVREAVEMTKVIDSIRMICP